MAAALSLPPRPPCRPPPVLVPPGTRAHGELQPRGSGGDRRLRALQLRPPPVSAGLGSASRRGGGWERGGLRRPGRGGPEGPPHLRGTRCGSPAVGSTARPEQAPLRYCWGCLVWCRRFLCWSCAGDPRVGAGNGHFSHALCALRARSPNQTDRLHKAS
ncbi:hypothetical protein Nmel_014034 [Mimus melanotis]